MIKKNKNWTAAAFLFLFLLPLASAQITPNIWKKFIGEPVPAGTPDLIDYSYAGYKNGAEGIPEDFGYTVYDVTHYGAIPDDGKSDSAGIRAALSPASSGRSIVFFPPGQYDVMLDDDVKDPFIVRGDHVILRGSGAQGAGRGGTTIKMHNQLTDPTRNQFLFVVQEVDFGWDGSPRVKGSFPSKIKYFDVNKTTPLIGRKYIAIRAFNLLGEDFDKYSSRPLKNISEFYTGIHKGVNIREYHEIDRIEGYRVYLKAPLVTHLKHGMRVVWTDLSEGIGFEDLHIDGGYDAIYEHLQYYGRGGIGLYNTAHSWIRRCRFSNVISSFRVTNSYGSSAVSNIVDGRFGHNLSDFVGSTYCLIAFLHDYSDRGMWHGANVSHWSAGSVVWHVGGPSAKGPDVHGSQPRHTLFDNYKSINHHTSSGGGNAMPNHLDGYVRWNNTANSSETLDLWGRSGGQRLLVTQGSLIGYKALGGAIPRNAYFEGYGTHVSPDSLYEAQLEHRLGVLPVWVNAYKKMNREFVQSIVIDPGHPITPADGDVNLDPSQGGPKIRGPWLWVLVPDEILDKSTDLLAKASGGTVTEQHIATTGVTPGDAVGDYVWTSLKISDSGGNNITNMTRPLNWNGNNRVIYGFITLNSPKEQNTRMFVGSDDSVKVWLNGELVREEIVGRSASDYRGSFPATLKQGRNTLLVAVENRTGGWSGFFGFQADAEYTVRTFAGIGYALPNVEISTGDTFTLDIYAEDATDLVEWQFDIAFDPARLEAIEVRKGYLLASEGGETSFQNGTIDNQSGNIIGLSEVKLNKNSVNGTGLLLSVTFSAKADGETQLTLNNFQLTSGAGQAISAGPYEVALVVKHRLIWDVNGDRRVNILDLVLVAQNMGQPVSVNSRTDVNGDGTVNILDLVLVAQHLGESTTGAAPAIIAIENVKGLGALAIQAWIEQARAEDDGSFTFRQGIANLERLLVALIPEETVLLPNYPNPFNPETWIPYQLSEPAEVTLTIYAVNGTKVRTLVLGLMPAGIYQSRNRAAYWDGRNNIGEPVASGLYFYSLTAGEFKSTRKMLIRK